MEWAGQLKGVKFEQIDCQRWTLRPENVGNAVHYAHFIKSNLT